MEVKDLIRIKRLEKGLTMKELAAKINVSEASISRWESGEVDNMKRSAIAAISDVLDISPIDLVGYKEVQYTPIPTARPTLTPKDEKHIAKLLESLLNDVESGITFAVTYGTIDDEVEHELFKKNLREALAYAKKKAKEKYTPKKYRTAKRPQLNAVAEDEAYYD